MYGIDIGEGSGVVSESALKCMLNAGKKFVIFEAWDCGYNIIHAVAENVKNAQAAGFEHIDIYGFFAPGCGNGNSPASSAIQTLHSFLTSNGVSYGTFWLDVEPLNGVWNGDSENINYVAELADEAQKLGMNVGVYSSIGSWGDVVGSVQSKSLSELPLWYAHYDQEANYDDSSFYKFNGWTKPAMKQYGGIPSVTLCGVNVDLDWTGDMSPSSGGKPSPNSGSKPSPSSGGKAKPSSDSKPSKAKPDSGKGNGSGKAKPASEGKPSKAVHSKAKPSKEHHKKKHEKEHKHKDTRHVESEEHM